MELDFNKDVILLSKEYTMQAVPEGSLIGSFSFFKSYSVNPFIDK